MKIKTSEFPVKEFTPIILELTIESKEELCNLWHQFNFSWAVREEFANRQKAVAFCEDVDFDKVWKKIDDWVQYYGLSK